MCAKPFVLIQQAYSRENSGDGLLVDLSLNLLGEAFGEDGFEYVLFANNAESFGDLKPVVQVPCTSDASWVRLTGSLRNVLSIARFSSGRRKFPYSIFEGFDRQPDLIIGVGGGYLRGKGAVESLKCLLNNTTQLLWASHAKVPFLYLPQSVGPFSYKMHAEFVRGALRPGGQILCRDDRSVAQLGLTSASRFPDLAVMELARTLKVEEAGGVSRPRKHLLVCRDLNCSSGKRQRYIANLRRLQEALEMEVVLQSTGRGNNDSVFCQEVFGKTKYRTLRECNADGCDYTVVSVRLHGAIEAMLGGHPAIHLSYERKGFGAYGDLGIDDYVFNSTTFDYEEVESKLRMLATSEQNFWRAIARSRETILQRRAELVDQIRAMAGSE